jgi:hypothetical protein
MGSLKTDDEIGRKIKGISKMPRQDTNNFNALNHKNDAPKAVFQ